MTETRFEDLKISNDFMFKEVMKSNKELCKQLVGSIMQQETFTLYKWAYLTASFNSSSVKLSEYFLAPKFFPPRYTASAPL